MVSVEARGGAQPKLALPERPRLAEGVKLAGQMRESAFVDPPWLIEREGEGYVQVTELLYRIAEALDGQRSLDDIAQHVSQATGRSVTRENVEQLLATQFVKKGLAPASDGTVVKANTNRRALLQINMRLRAIDGRSIEPLLQVLKWLYWPPLLGAVLLIALAAEIWLYFVHGVAAGVRDALYAPGLLLAILAGTVAAAAFHELGHAAALRYGGGYPRGMGAGIYIVYPAFYTDVTDSYRLGRWARVRTDLGGFYFNVLFALAAMGAYVLTGQEILLLIVSLLNLEVLRQLMPLTRLDGYWVLADLTGVPDFISHIGAFIRSIRPGTQQTRKLPPLKPWARVIFALYIVVTTPLLALQVILMLRGFPRVLATGWHSALTQLDAIGQAQASGNMGAAALSVLQLLALGLPSLAILFSAFRFGQRFLGQLWRWSAASAGRRAVAIAAILALAAVLSWSWLPRGTGQGQGQYEPIQPEERGTLNDVVLPAQPTAQPPLTSTPTPAAEPTQATAPTPNPGIALSPVPAASPLPVELRASPVASPIARPPSPTPARN